MRTTIDIPDDTYRALKIKAAREGMPVRQIVLDGIHRELHRGTDAKKHDGRPRFPVIRSKRPGSLKLGEEGVYEYIPFP
jgi:hypothetical protein